MEFIDISVPLRDGMLHYEGNPPIHLTRVQSIAGGDTANVSKLDLGVHSGTHVDAPVHFLDGAPGVEALPFEAMIGPVEVVDATGVREALDLASVRELELPRNGTERVLFKTRNSQLWERDEFTRDFVRFSGDGAQLMLERGIKLVGIDYLSIGDQDAHRAFLGAGVVALEGLDLRAVEPGSYELICLPLSIPGSDGAPARAVLVRRDR